MNGGLRVVQVHPDGRVLEILRSSFGCESKRSSILSITVMEIIVRFGLKVAKVSF